MKRFVYILGRILKMDYKELFKVVRLVNKITKRGVIPIFVDVVKCGFRYGAGFNDYLLCEFYNLTDQQRATYVTRGVNNTLVSLLNNRDYYHIFDNKNEFYAVFSDFMGRGWMDFSSSSSSEFEKFMKTRNVVISKPLSESCGNGVEKVFKNDYISLHEMAEYLKKINCGIIEDVITQHSEISKLYSNSVNTLRIVTVLNENGSHIVYAYIRIGNSDRPVDNLHAGGMCAPIDLDTGVLNFPGYDKQRKEYSIHPRSGEKIIGFKIPFWNKTVDLCLRAAMIVPEMKYIGWDVAITNEGPVFVEGNNLPGYDFLQMPPHVPDKIGMLPRFKLFVKGL